MREAIVLAGIFLAGLVLIGIYSKWISYNVAKGFYEGKKAFFNNLQEIKKNEKDEEKR